jgi:hypothetical protein
MNKLLIAIGLIVLTACSSQSLTDYASNKPELRLETFFNGKLKAYGLVKDRSGTVTRSFVVDLVGTWDNNKGELVEDFVYNDGEKSQRIWYLEKVGNDTYLGTASDVVGTAKGKVSGNALHWQYQLVIDYDGADLEITLDDWMYLVDNDNLINTTKLYKFGFEVGEVVLSIHKLN